MTGLIAFVHGSPLLVVTSLSARTSPATKAYSASLHNRQECRIMAWPHAGAS